VLQVPELQLEQPPLPATGVLMPLESLVKEQNRDKARSEAAPQRGQIPFSVARLTGRMASNFCLHSGQQYS
jgi:hypothetical protein